MGDKDQSRLEALRAKRDNGFLTQQEKIEMFMLDELDQKGDYLIAKYIKAPSSLSAEEGRKLLISLTRYYEQKEGLDGNNAARQAVNDLLSGNWGYKSKNYDYPYLSHNDHKEQYNDAYWDSVEGNSHWIVKWLANPLTSREQDKNELYYREQYNIQKYLQSTEWERQVGRPVMNFLPGGIGFAYNAIDTAQGSYSLGEGINQIYSEGKFSTDATLRVIDGILTLSPIIVSNILPKGNTSIGVGFEPSIPKTVLSPGNNAIGSINFGKTGTITFEKGSTPNANEVRAGTALLGLGYDVVIKKEINLNKVRTPDFWVDGIGKVDVYTPKTVSSKNIINAIEKKDSQASSVLLQIDLSGKDMSNIASRIWGKPNVKNINTIFFQDSKVKFIALIALYLEINNV